MKLINNKLTVAICVALSLTACSPKMTTEQYLAQAESFSKTQDYNSAVIALKNAIKLSENNSEARYALGSAYLAQGDYFNAEKELEKAEELGSDNLKLIEDIVKVKVKLQKFDYVYEIVEQSRSFPNEQQVVILTYAGIASIHQSKPEQAKEYIDRAVNISDDSIYGKIGKAYLSHSGNDFTNGLDTVNELLSSTPGFAEAILLKGYLLQASEEFSAAAKTFQEYEELRPKDVQVKFFIAQNYVFAGQFEDAEPYVNLLLKIAELHPLANQIKAEIEYSKKDYKSALAHAVKSFQQNNSFNTSKVIAGISAYKLGDFEQSYQYLISIKDMLPQEHLVRKLIIDLQLKLGYDIEAVSSLQALIDVNEADTAILTMASNQMLISGNTEAAQELLQASIELDTSEPSELAKQGVTQLRLNQADKGIEILEKALRLDPDLAFAEQSLAVGYLVNSQFTEAKKIAEKWQKSENKQIQGYLLESSILVKQKKNVEAQLLLNKVLTLDSDNVPALYKLGVYSHKEKNIEQAYNYYTKILTLEPQHMGSIINLTRLIAITTKDNNEYSDKAIAFYEAILVDKPNNNFTKLGLAYVYKSVKRYNLAIKLLQEIAKSATPITGINIVLGDTYSAMGDWENAIQIYQDFLRATPENLYVAHKIFSLYEQHNQLDKALELLEKTIRFNQDNAGLLLLKSYYQSLLKVEPNQSELTKIKTNSLTKEHWLLDKALGNFAYNKKDFELSIKHYASAYKKEANEVNVINWSKSVALNGNKKQAIVILEQHLAALDVGIVEISVQVMLGGAYLNNNRLTDAVNMYESILLQEPNNLVSLNNLSYLELQKGNAKASLTYAKRAIDLAKNNAGIIDTYAQALTANKQFTLAIEQYDKALNISGNNTEIAKHKAKALELKASTE